MMLELVSVHIPKTGGRSLLRILTRKYGWALRLVYPPPQSPWNRRMRAQIRGAARNLPTLLGARAIHGHFAASAYATPGAEMITFLRDPIRQRISTYHFHRRRHEQGGMIANEEGRRALDLDLEEFVAFNEPIFSLFLDLPMDRFSFIGTMETYDDDIQKLCSRLGIDYNPVHQNANPSGSDYEISATLRRRYEAANSREIEIYESALRRRKELSLG